MRCGPNYTGEAKPAAGKGSRGVGTIWLPRRPVRQVASRRWLEVMTVSFPGVPVAEALSTGWQWAVRRSH